jgi:hypothetical protein
MLPGWVLKIRDVTAGQYRMERKYNVKLPSAGLFAIGPSATSELCEFLLW